MQNILRKVDLIILVVIALVAIVLSVLDFFNLTGEISPNYPLFTLFLLSMVGIHLIVSHFSQEDFRSDTTTLLERIATGVSVADFRIFNDSIEIESYLAKRMIEAKKSICDLTWKSKISEGFSASNRQLAHGYMDKCITEVSDRISYREIFIFNDPRRVEKLERRLSEKKKGYSCRYFKDDTPIPRLQFVIVDDEEVFFFASSADSILCSSCSKELCRVFRSYYEAVWNVAIPIKDGPKIDENQVTIIRNAQVLPGDKKTIQ
ncbi:MAG: hypothetical protein KKF98_11395 [Bacteroidetes bacterium]|nr:hypothetical protein [Bacteroidota bacterium]